MELVFRLACIEILSKYRKTYLGIFWLWISFALKVIFISIVYSRVFGKSFEDYFLFLTVGFCCWNFISGVMLSSINTLHKSRSMLLQYPKYSLYFYVFKDFLKEFITFLSLLTPFCLVMYVQDYILFPDWMLLVGLGFLCIILFLLGSSLAYVSLIFRDVTQLVPSLVHLAFLITPVLWEPDQFAVESVFLKYNPFYYLISYVRDPILGGAQVDCFLYSVLVIASFSAFVLIFLHCILWRKYRALL